MAQEDNPLSRWSRLKQESRKLEQEKAQAKEVPQTAAQDDAPPPLPPLESLTPASDFSAFMHPKVQDSLRRVALKKLFADPHFNVEDLNEAYSGDWTGGDPITPEMLKRLNQARTHLFSDEERQALEEEDRKVVEEEERLARPAEAETPPGPEQPTQQAKTQETKDDEPGRQDT